MNETYFVSTHDEGRTAPICIDLVLENDRGAYSGETLEQIRLRYPNVAIMDRDTYKELHDNALTGEPVEITEDKFQEMLECLPPMKWNNSGHTETFMMCEYWSGSITGIYCRIGEKFYSFNGLDSMTHLHIVDKCLKSVERSAKP